MKKLLLTLLLVVAALGYAQQPTSPPSAQAGSTAAQSEAQQSGEIKDPAEYTAYVSAVQTQDPTQKATALEAFLQSYPNSIMKKEVTRILMLTYYQLSTTDSAKYTPKVTDAAQRLLQLDPNNLVALTLLCSMNYEQSGGPNGAQMLQQAAQYGERGLQQLQSQAKPPEGVTEQQWALQKSAFQATFQRAVAQAAFNKRDFATAIANFSPVAATDQSMGDPHAFADVYQLGLAYLQQVPPSPDGFFWIARAAAIGPPSEAQGILNYGRDEYRKYHGTEDGWDQIVAQAKNSATKPANFTVAPAPPPTPPGEQAAQMLQKDPPENMSFGQWEFILTSGNQQAADQVWNWMKGKLLQFQAPVISANTTTIRLAGSVDDIAAKKADIELTLTTPLSPSGVPRAGAEIKFSGVPNSYDPNPFLIRMSDGSILGRGAGASAPPKRSPR